MRAALILLATCAVAVPAVPAQAAAPAPSPSMAVMPFHVENLALNDGQRLEAAVRARAAARGYEVQPQATTTQIVEASQSLGLDCDINAVECGAKMGKIADVKYILLAHASGGLDGHVGIDAEVIDVALGERTRQASALLPADADAQADALTSFADTLFSEIPLLTLTVTADPAGAEIAVDGIARGVSPLKDPIGGLVAGDHFVLVKKAGYLPFRSRVGVVPTTPATVSVNLAVDPDAVRSGGGAAQTTPLIVAGVAGGVALAGGIAAIVGYIPYGHWSEGTQIIRDIDTSNKLGPTQVQQISDAADEAKKGAEDWKSWGQPLFIGGLVAAGVGIVVAAGAGAWGAFSAEPTETAALTKPAAALK